MSRKPTLADNLRKQASKSTSSSSLPQQEKPLEEISIEEALSENNCELILSVLCRRLIAVEERLDELVEDLLDPDIVCEALGDLDKDGFGEEIVSELEATQDAGDWF